MDAAMKLIADHGVGGTSLQMIADTVGVTKAAIYHQFKTKEQIVIALTERELGGLEEALEAAEAEDHPPRARELLLDRVIDLTAALPAPCYSIRSLSGCSANSNHFCNSSSASTVSSSGTPVTTAGCWRQ
jgi:AcrR family transcriptional regulator